MAEVTKESVIDFIANMSVLELSEMVKEMEEKFGVSAAAPVAVMASADSSGSEEVQSEKTEFDVVLNSPGDKKIAVIKEVRAITGLSLKEAKALVDEAPKPVKEAVSAEEADKLKSRLEDAGAQIEIK